MGESVQRSVQVEAEGHALDAEFTGPGRLSREECIGKVPAQA